jgi:hypothetical protein
MRGLRPDRFDPNNLEALEQHRWKCVLKLKTILTGPWREMLNMFPNKGYVYGHHTGRLVCFEYDGNSLSHNYPEEFGGDQRDFVRCLEDKELPLFIHSEADIVKEGVKKRLGGDSDYAQYEHREDIVQLYFKLNKKIYRIQRAIGYYEQIIGYHFSNLIHRINHTHGYSNLIISLVLNNRTYVYQDSQFFIKPETYNPVFSVQDLLSSGPIIENQPTILANEISACERYKKALETLNRISISTECRGIIHEALYPKQK